MIWVVIFLCTGVLIAILKPKIKGWVGETVVATILSSLPKEEYRVLNNVMLRTERGTSQCDHIVVSVYGIFVIETKNYKGWITGGEFSETWTKNMYGNKYSFYNPLKQNYGHVKALQGLLGLSEDMFIPIVVFSVNAELKVKTAKTVIYTTQLRREIKSYTEQKLALSQLEEIQNTISSSNIDSAGMRREHVRSIRTNTAAKEEKARQNICPMCNGTLVQRKGRNGYFIGCSNYPSCRYTAKN